MDDQTKAELVEGVNTLIRSPNAHALYQAMLTAAPVMARHKEVRLTGEAAILNALALAKTSHPDRYEAIIELVERKRAEAGYDPLEAPNETKFDKSQYMQAFMEQKRLRQRRAAEIENLQRGERDKLVGRSRLDFMQRQSAVWKRERDTLLERAKAAAAPRRLKKDDIARLLEQFWSSVDARLDELEHAARSGRFSGRDATSLADLEAVLRHDPYK